MAQGGKKLTQGIRTGASAPSQSIYIHMYNMSGMIGMHFSCMLQRSLGLLRLLLASAFTSEISREVLQRWQVPQAQVETTIAAANSSCLPRIKQRLQPKLSKPWHSSFLKHHWPYKIKEVTGFKARERTRTNN